MLARHKAAAAQAEAAIATDRAALRAAREHALAVARAKAATPQFLLAAFAAGFVIGAVGGRRAAAPDERSDGPRIAGAERYATLGAVLLRLLDYYVRRS